MHTASCLLINGFWQESRGFSLRGCHIFNDILDNHRIVCHFRHIRQLHFDLHLTGATYLVMMVFYPDSPVFHHHTDAAAQVISHILRSCHMVSTLTWYFISIVTLCVQAAIPVRLSRVNPVSALSGCHFIAGTVKQIELELRSDHHPVRNALFLHIFYCPKAHIFRVLIKRPIFALSNRTHIAAHRQCRHFCKRIHIGRIRVR